MEELRYETKQCGDVVVIKYIDSRNITVKFVNTGNIKKGVTMSSLISGSVADRSELYYGRGHISDTDVKLSNQAAYVKWRTLIGEHYIVPEWLSFDCFVEHYNEHYKVGHVFCHNFYGGELVGPDTVEYLTRSEYTSFKRILKGQPTKIKTKSQRIKDRLLSLIK